MIHVMVLAADRPGVLRRILGVYESRRYQVRSLAAGPAGPAGFLRINLALDEPAPRAQRLAAQLGRLVDVVSVEVVEPSRAVGRELALVKVLLDHPGRRADVLQVAQVFRARVVDVAPRSLVLEVTGDPAKVEAFLNLAEDFGPVEVMRTGVAALGRGGRLLPGGVTGPGPDRAGTTPPADETAPAVAGGEPQGAATAHPAAAVEAHASAGGRIPAFAPVVAAGPHP
ncbi:acetolactate synthase, small subunit [Thermaerobacter marianensis DSM 12885]|uniref:acetolactate synthase n=1 Tax=Thermaerobacter marianensis (strain ATCC 700841 / DSM 12885 / JCM 10246 / 7p75a) TaxID=644966 RepID=E6SHZ3_THEM7|nr:acetolactate synthase small subunit [Thermaerobacter marianensis]ADU51873.1 acetolactate synthase, small subunit [Thermaerobacter marianensis DSM 12885]